MSTVCPTILNLTSLTVARSESARAFLARFLASALFAGDAVLSPAGLLVVSATAALRAALVWVISVSHVYCGSAFEISNIRCDQRYRESSIDLMIAICWYSESR